jgi:hypothetical protein
MLKLTEKVTRILKRKWELESKSSRLKLLISTLYSSKREAFKRINPMPTTERSKLNQWDNISKMRGNTIRKTKSMLLMKRQDWLHWELSKRLPTTPPERENWRFKSKFLKLILLVKNKDLLNNKQTLMSSRLNNWLDWKKWNSILLKISSIKKLMF